MELYSLIILAVSFVLILIVWGVFAYRHFHFWNLKMMEEWSSINAVMKKRQDLLPNLIETMRYCGVDDGSLIKKLIETRRSAALNDSNSEEKMALESNLESVIFEILEIGRKNKGLGTNTNYLELKKELQDLNQNLEIKIEKYNQMVSQFNKDLRGILWSWYSFLFRVKRKKELS